MVPSYPLINCQHLGPLRILLRGVSVCTAPYSFISKSNKSLKNVTRCTLTAQQRTKALIGQLMFSILALMKCLSPKTQSLFQVCDSI